MPHSMPYKQKNHLALLRMVYECEPFFLSLQRTFRFHLRSSFQEVSSDDASIDASTGNNMTIVAFFRIFLCAFSRFRYRTGI